MKNNSFLLRRILRFGLIVGVLSAAAISVAAQEQDGDDVLPPRGIVPVFSDSRPPVAAIKPPKKQGAKKPPAKVNVKPPRPTYQRISQKINSGKIASADKPKRPNKQNKPKPNPNKPAAQPDVAIAKAQQIGVTLWHLMTADFRGGGEKDLFIDSEKLPEPGQNGRSRILTPRRVSLDNLFAAGDYVRMSFEAARRGHLYVVDQEMYADGTTGDAYLVFPNKRIRSGANLLAPGKPIELPDLKGNPFYFELRPQSANGKTIISEILTVIITDKPIAGLVIGDAPALISPEKLAVWRKKWSGAAEIFEREIQTQNGYSTAERQAANGAGKLTAFDALPNTVFLVEGNKNGGTLITVPLWYENK